MTRRAWFVTGTDTGVGKTVATAALAVLLAGRSPYVYKAAQSGVTADEPGDLEDVRRLAGDVPGGEGVRLRAALAPDAAARLEGVGLPDLEAQTTAVAAFTEDHHVLVEGAGGVLVPLGADWNLIDLAGRVSALGIEAAFIVVARAGLGTLNHTCLTVEAIHGAGLHVGGVVIGSWPSEPDLAERENLVDLPRLSRVPLLGRIPEGAGALPSSVFRESAPQWLRLPD